jgi:hypothetical protein
MDEHQRRIWQRMLADIDAFSEDRMNLSRLVSNLKGHFDAAEIADQKVRDESMTYGSSWRSRTTCKPKAGVLSRSDLGGTKGSSRQ